MKRNFLGLLLGAAFSVFLPLSCGGGDDGGKKGKSIALEDVPDSFYDVICQRSIDCPNPVFFDNNWKLFSDKTECVNLIKKIMSGEVEGPDYLVQAVKDGKAEYDGEQAYKCINTLKTMSCEQLAKSIDLIPECMDVFKGKLKDGEACNSDDECEGGWCDSSQAECGGECKQAAGEGEDCSYELPCKAGLVCADGKCTADFEPPGEGEDCANDGPTCAYGLFCNEQNKCEKKKAEGEGCKSSEDCEFGLGCFGEENNWKCAKVEIVGENEDCDPYMGKLCDIGKMLFCAMNFSDDSYEKCHKFGEKGDTCLDQDKQLVYACNDLDNLYCDYTADGKCTDKKAAGEDCNPNLQGQDCLSGICGQDSKCEADPCENS